MVRQPRGDYLAMLFLSAAEDDMFAVSLTAALGWTGAPPT